MSMMRQGFWKRTTIPLAALAIALAVPTGDVHGAPAACEQCGSYGAVCRSEADPANPGMYFNYGCRYCCGTDELIQEGYPNSFAHTYSPLPNGTIMGDPCNDQLLASCAANPEACGDGVDSDLSEIHDNGCGSQNQCTMHTVAPIDLANGFAKTLPMVDFELHGANGDDIRLVRTYRSITTLNDSGDPHPGRARIVDSSLGHGFTHNLQTRLELYGDAPEPVLYVRQNGDVVRFERPISQCGFYNVSKSYPFIKLSCNGTTGYAVEEGSEVRAEFDLTGKIVSWRDGNGSFPVLFTYYLGTGTGGLPGALESVGNSSGQTVYFKYATSTLGTTVDRVCLNDPVCAAGSASVLVQYSYDLVGNVLHPAIAPNLTEVNITPNDPVPEHRRRVTYEYTEASYYQEFGCGVYRCTAGGGELCTPVNESGADRAASCGFRFG